ncbi:tyrosyl-DNA phosphodiesterase-domain-containing protein [Lineolata rhizophorae]|uniref:Tyrosyl-DNA phosphodiesterase-domain-containing protein n=1 Tax=Lineolata rhizophorae TaxID=578093 RepID=A0A6A6PE62_9PEZI|nr:tyrosyl-DNA phosphodiesterase-domain-containing protein [Lineolata rhizophorae]
MDRAYFGQSTTGGHSSHALSQGGPPVEENYVHLGPGVQNHFWSGALKRTWIYNFQRLGDDIRLEEVLKARDLETAYLCSYEFDAPWLFSKLELSRTKLFLVMHADNEQKHFYRQECKSLGLDVTPIFPPARSGNMTSMHSKLMILKYIGSVRIVVPTGNLQPADWGETGHMENMVFIIDLPRNEAMAPPTPVEHLPIFGQELLRFVDALGLDSSAQNMLRRHNWHNTRPFGFVHSIPGTHNGTNMYKTGMPLLNNLVQQLGLGAYDNQRILSSWVDYMTSSLGRLKEDYVANFYRALQGEFDASNQPRTGRKMTKPEREYRKKLHERFHIVYPCNKTVQESIGGSGGAGTICLAHDYWIDDDFPKKLMHDLKSVRRGVLNHAKMILVRTHVSTGLSVHEFTMKCWAFVGSHNFSESAWGKTQRMRGSDDENRHKLIVRNYECGVIVPVGPDTIASYTWPALGEDEFVILEDEVPGYDIFLGSIPIPAAMPPERYNRYNQPGGRVTSRKVPFTFNPEQNPTTDVVPVDNETEAESSEEDGEEDDEL